MLESESPTVSATKSMLEPTNSMESPVLPPPIIGGTSEALSGKQATAAVHQTKCNGDSDVTSPVQHTGLQLPSHIRAVNGSSDSQNLNELGSPSESTIASLTSFDNLPQTLQTLFHATAARPRPMRTRGRSIPTRQARPPSEVRGMTTSKSAGIIPKPTEESNGDDNVDMERAPTAEEFRARLELTLGLGMMMRPLPGLAKPIILKKRPQQKEEAGNAGAGGNTVPEKPASELEAKFKKLNANANASEDRAKEQPASPTADAVIPRLKKTPPHRDEDETNAGGNAAVPKRPASELEVKFKKLNAIAKEETFASEPTSPTMVSAIPRVKNMPVQNESKEITGADIVVTKRPTSELEVKFKKLNAIAKEETFASEPTSPTMVSATPRVNNDVQKIGKTDTAIPKRPVSELEVKLKTVNVVNTGKDLPVKEPTTPTAIVRIKQATASDEGTGRNGERPVNELAAKFKKLNTGAGQDAPAKEPSSPKADALSPKLKNIAQKKEEVSVTVDTMDPESPGRKLKKLNTNAGEEVPTKEPTTPTAGIAIARVKKIAQQKEDGNGANNAMTPTSPVGDFAVKLKKQSTNASEEIPAKERSPTSPTARPIIGAIATTAVTAALPPPLRTLEKKQDATADASANVSEFQQKLASLRRSPSKEPATGAPVSPRGEDSGANNAVKPTLVKKPSTEDLQSIRGKLRSLSKESGNVTPISTTTSRPTTSNYSQETPASPNATSPTRVSTKIAPTISPVRAVSARSGSPTSPIRPASAKGGSPTSHKRISGKITSPTSPSGGKTLSKSSSGKVLSPVKKSNSGIA